VEFELLILNVYQPEELICELLVYFDLKEGFDGHVDYELKFFFCSLLFLILSFLGKEDPNSPDHEISKI
jgi:hypothetical protein